MRSRKGYVFYDEKAQRWIARTSITDDNGKRRFVKKRTKSKAEAEVWLKSLLRQIDDDGSKVVDFNQMTFNQLAAHYEEFYLKAAEYINGHKIFGLRDVDRPKQLLKHFREYFGSKKLREISYVDLLRYRDKRLKVPTQYKRQRTVASWNREAAVLRRIFNIACQQGWMIKNPFHCGDPLIVVSAERRKERILSLSEESKLLEACDSHPYRQHLKSLLIFLLDTGCRKGEALKLCWRSICFATKVITLEATTTKTLRSRQVGMTERLLTELAALYESSTKDANERVFGISNNVRKSFASVCQIAGIKHGGFDGITLHSLRRTCATRLVKSGMSPQLAGKLLGHSQINTTYAFYLSADSETMAQAAAILESFQTKASEPLEASDTVN
jgi:integrase